MANYKFTLKRGTAGADTLYPATVWEQVLNKPATYAPTAHGHDYTSISNLGLAHVATSDYATSAGTATSATYADSAGSAPASDVYGWAKAANKPSYNASEIGGLGASYRWLTDSYISTWNAKQDAIAAGTTAQYWRGDKTWQAMPTSLPASDVYGWAKAADKPSYTYSEVGAAAASHSHAIADVTGLQTALDGKAASSHAHGDISSTGAITSAAVAFSSSDYMLVADISASGAIKKGPQFADSSSYGVLGSTSTSIPTERDVYWGTHYSYAALSAAIASSATYTTMTFGAGARNFVLEIHQDSTTGAIIARLPLIITGGSNYSLDTSARTHRVAWSNGSVSQVMNVDLYYSGNILYFKHDFSGANLAFRLFQM